MCEKMNRFERASVKAETLNTIFKNLIADKERLTYHLELVKNEATDENGEPACNPDGTARYVDAVERVPYEELPEENMIGINIYDQVIEAVKNLL